ncbi:MAG: EamA family transporter, partial [Xanthobacteraceae bacterium]
MTEDGAARSSRSPAVGFPPSAVARPLDTMAALVAVVLCLSWGFNQVAVKLALPEIPPLIQAAFRSTFGALIVVAWARARGVKLMEP